MEYQFSATHKKDVIAITIYNIQLRVVALRKNYDEMITWKS